MNGSDCSLSILQAKVQRVTQGSSKGSLPQINHTLQGPSCISTMTCKQHNQA